MNIQQFNECFLLWAKTKMWTSNSFVSFVISLIHRLNNLALFSRKMASGGMVARLPTGRVRLQREGARSLLGNFHEIYLKMNWCHCVRR